MALHLTGENHRQEATEAGGLPRVELLQNLELVPHHELQCRSVWLASRCHARHDHCIKGIPRLLLQAAVKNDAGHVTFGGT